MRVLFFCTYLAGYLFESIKYLAADDRIKVRIVHYGEYADAPFVFSDAQSLISQKDAIPDLLEFSLNFSPDICFVAGWIDKQYLRVAKTLRKQDVRIVCAVDNPWKGSLRQQLGILRSRIYLRKVFDYMWVAGKNQYRFAREMGFPPQSILPGLYVADTRLFSEQKKSIWKKELLYAGRLEEVKGVKELYDTFMSLGEGERNGWKLCIIGNGSLRNRLHNTSTISVDNFIQQDKLALLAATVGAFILPSHYEHWGVVVQEFGAAGLPLLVSSEVNAREEYVIHNYNGYVFTANDTDSLRKTLVHLFHLEEKDLQVMGNRSQKLAMRWNHEYWKATLLSTVDLK